MTDDSSRAATLATLERMSRDYLELLVSGDRRKATQMVVDAAASGTSVRDIYLHVFQPAQYEIGRRWQTNEITVADEHYCTAATQLTMSLLYKYLFDPSREERNHEPIIVAAIAGELHELGARMVADILESEAWNTQFLGANTPSDALVQMTVARNASIVSISVTLPQHIDEAADLVTSLRATPNGAKLSILVGGGAFASTPNLWREIGANATSADAVGAVSEVERLMASH